MHERKACGEVRQAGPVGADTGDEEQARQGPVEDVEQPGVGVLLPDNVQLVGGEGVEEEAFDGGDSGHVVGFR